jgi:hypothetical protein
LYASRRNSGCCHYDGLAKRGECNLTVGSHDYSLIYKIISELSS